MQRFFNFFLAAISAVLFVSLFACHDDCPLPTDPNACNPNGTCNLGFECDEGTCKCLEPGFILNKNCVKFGGSGPAWKGVSSTCYCYDTLGFGISGEGTNRSLSMAFAEGSNIGSANTGIKYFEMPSGDSFYVFQMPIKCLRPSAVNKTVPEAFGKISPDGDLLLRLVFRDAVTFEYVDECTTTLKKVK